MAPPLLIAWTVACHRAQVQASQLPVASCQPGTAHQSGMDDGLRDQSDQSDQTSTDRRTSISWAFCPQHTIVFSFRGGQILYTSHIIAPSGRSHQWGPNSSQCQRGPSSRMPKAFPCSLACETCETQTERKSRAPESLHAERLTSMLWCNLSVSELGNGLYGSFVSCLYTSSSISSYAGTVLSAFLVRDFICEAHQLVVECIASQAQHNGGATGAMRQSQTNRTVADNSSLHKVLPKMLTSTQLPASHLTNRTKSYMIIMIIIPWSIVSYCIPMKYPQIPMIDGETWWNPECIPSHLFIYLYQVGGLPRCRLVRHSSRHSSASPRNDSFKKGIGSFSRWQEDRYIIYI